MLYKLPALADNEDPRYAVIDFRPKMPVDKDDIIVPIYPIIGDMLNISGDDDNIWIAHVLSVSHDSKTCRVHFYVESSVPGKYIRETINQHSVEVIHWDSIIECANGFWEGGFWYQNC